MARKHAAVGDLEDVAAAIFDQCTAAAHGSNPAGPSQGVLLRRSRRTFRNCARRLHGRRSDAAKHCALPLLSDADAGLKMIAADVGAGPAPQQQLDSSSRPTRAVGPVACSASKRLSTEIARSAAQSRAGPAMPLRSLSPRSSSSKRLPRSFRVPSAMTTLFGSAIACRRPGQGLLGASLGKHAIAGAVRRQSERDQPLFSGQSTTHRGTGNAPFPAQLGPSSAWR